MSKTRMAKIKKYCLTPKFRMSFPHLFEAHAGFANQEAKYSCTMLFDKNADLKEMKRAERNAIINKWGPDSEKWPKNLKSPFRDGNEKSDLEGYAGMIFVAASSKQRPGVVNQKREPIVKEDEAIYPGCYARASLIAYAYDKAGNKGVAFGLQNVQKQGDGDPFSGRKKAEDEFDEVEDLSDDSSNYQEPSEDDDDIGL